MFKMTREHPHSSVLIGLIRPLDEELCQIDGKAQLDSDPHNKLGEDDIALVAWESEIAVACGAYGTVADRADVVEIKRMYEQPSSGRRGLAITLLCRLQQHAAKAGYRKAQRETGTSQPEAIALYEREG